MILFLVEYDLPKFFEAFVKVPEVEVDGLLFDMGIFL